MRARNPLYIMAKPPVEVASHIAALPRNDAKRPPELLHVTLLLLFDLSVAPPEWLPAIIQVMDDFAGNAFPLTFDRIENRKAVTLRARDPLVEARACQAALVRHLVERRAPLLLGTTPVPHVTINYAGDRLGAQKIAPIGWTVEEVLLIESVVGKARHIVHGRWRLATP